MNAQVQDSSFHTVSEYPAKSKTQPKKLKSEKNAHFKLTKLEYQSQSIGIFFPIFSFVCVDKIGWSDRPGHRYRYIQTETQGMP